MLKKKIFHIAIIALGIMILAFQTSHAQQRGVKQSTSSKDSVGVLSYPFDDEGAFDYPDELDQGPLYLKQPTNVKREIEYDPDSKQYIIYEKVGNVNYRLPKTMSLKEYVQYDFDQAVRDYWRSRDNVEQMQNATGGLIPQLKIESQIFDNIFGGNTIDIRPQGYVEVSFGYESNYIADPTRPERLRRVPSFDFNQQINLSVTGKIGDKVDMKVNFDSEATFDYENKMNINYVGKEDEILRKIEAGNVSLPLNGTLIQGGTNLFGLKTEMQFGHLNVTTVISQSKGESQTIESEGGAQRTKFDIKASDYDENRHFFLSKYFRDNYDKSMALSPAVILSKVKINKIEVWVTNTSKDYTGSRDIVSFVDLGEPEEYIYNKIPEFAGAAGQIYPDNKANGLYEALNNGSYSDIRVSSKIKRTFQALAGQFDDGRDWEGVDQARKLTERDYTVNRELGYISLKSPLNNGEVLAVAYNITVGSELLQVGEFASDVTDATNTLILKMLKGTEIAPNKPTWDLMMKNIYSLGAFDLSATDFDFNIVYADPNSTTVNFIPEGNLNGKPLIKVLNLDNANSQGDLVENGDGMFDFKPGYTVNTETGRIIFPVVEPFGSYLSSQLENDQLRSKYVFQALYDSTKIQAEQMKSLDRFSFVGSYKGSSGSEIMLNAFNLAPGSVKVSAGGMVLVENTDYTVDYSLGRVKIINAGILESGMPVQVSTESQDMFSMQRKSMVGSYASYRFSDKFNVGGTMLFLNERPITNKVDLGEEPVSNLMLGLDFQYNERSKLLTDIVNLLPFYDSETESSISLEGEVAKLVPGRSKQTGNTVYLDDFEGVETNSSFTSYSRWHLASTPQGQDDLFPEAKSNTLEYGYNRSKLAWYYIENTLNSKSTMPDYMKANLDLVSNHYTREVYQNEIFPGKEIPAGMPSTQYILNLAYYPKERGAYNYDMDNLDPNGFLKDPEKRWGGIMCEIETSNFDAANYEYIEFWLLDPFIYDDNNTNTGGDLYFNLGSVSEDILKDSRKAFENGLPTNDSIVNVDTTIWGRVSNRNLLNHAFANDANSRKLQDVGLDGLSDDDERLFFQDYLDKLKTILTPTAYTEFEKDPSGDNFHYFKGTDYDEQEKTILERYKKYNNMEGNSPVSGTTVESNVSTPDIEDINDDNRLNQLESYYQYKVSIRKADMVVGQNNVVDKVSRRVKLANGKYEDVNWYQFKIPIRSNPKAIGGISGFNSIRFMRVFMTGFKDSTIMRFATLNLVRSDWRKVTDNLAEKGAMSSASTGFDVTSINIEENGNREPINYILPPDITREDDISSPQLIKQNEQAMLFSIKDLEPGDARAVYKDAGVDLRQFKRLKMDVHAEAIEGYPLNDNELSLFIRFGNDELNYYEYEIPLKITPVPDVPYKGDLVSDRYIVWPDENRLNIDLEIFSKLKLDRDAAVRKAGSTITTNDIYSQPDENWQDGKNLVKIRGRYPTIGNVEQITIGVRYPMKNGMAAKSVEVWVNELRMIDYVQNGGWASNGRLSVRLADLGNITLAGSTKSVGWGAINESISQRSLDNLSQFDLSATVDLGKLTPEKLGLRMPLYYGYSQSVASPLYDPINSDLKLNDVLNLFDSPEARDSIKSKSQDVTTRKSLNITNVSIEPVRKNKERKAMPYNIENFSVSYAQNEQLTHNIDIEKYLIQNKKGVFNYNYSTTPKSIEPFKKVKFLNNKAFQIIRETNFSLMPAMISFRTDLNRSYSERQARDNSDMGNLTLPLTVQKDFLWNRAFDLRYNLTRNLNFDFSNQNTARIDELEGAMNRDSSNYNLMQEEIYRNIRNLGRQVDYQHTLNIRYTIPINKLPMLDWVSTNATYQGRYDWQAGPKLSGALADSMNLGNVANNGMTIGLNARAQLLSLYNKVPYLKKVNDKYQSRNRTYGSSSRRPTQPGRRPAEETKDPKRTKDVKFSEEKVTFKGDVPKSIFHKLKTKDVEVIVLSEKGDTIDGEITIVNENRVNFKSPTNVNNATVFVSGTRELGESLAKKTLDISTRMLMGLRSFSVVYNQTGSTVLPGFLPTPYIFGGSQYETGGALGQIQRSIAPTLPFLMGWQDEQFGLKAANKGWVTTDDAMTDQYLFRSKETYTFNAQIEPIPNIKIDLTGSHSRANNVNCNLGYQEGNGFVENARVETGNFEMSIMTLKTSFLRSERIHDGEAQPSALYDNFLQYRQNIITRLNDQRGFVDGIGYMQYENYDEKYMVNGYSETSMEVLIPAFLAAYTGTDPNAIGLSPFPGLKATRPNWRINYSGDPSSISWMKDYIQSLNFNHSYRATYSVGNFETNLNYDANNASGFSWVRSQQAVNNDRFESQYGISSVNISEAFSPLINMDIGWVNDLSTSFEISKQRNLSLNLDKAQITEMQKNDFTLGVGYRFTGMEKILKTKRKTENVSNDVNLRFDFTRGNNKTVYRDIVNKLDEIASGSKDIDLDFTADYMLSDRFTLKLFYKYSLRKPANTESYKNSHTNFGLSFNFSIL